MSKVLSILVFLASVFFMSGCGNGMQEKDADGFPVAQVLKADSIAIDEILMVEGKTLLRDYAVIYSPKTSKVLFRMILPMRICRRRMVARTTYGFLNRAAIGSSDMICRMLPPVRWPASPHRPAIGYLAGQYAAIRC